MNMEAFRIKHKPTGLFWQPHKHRGNTLSKTGKIYSKESYAKATIRNGVYVQVSIGSVVYRKTKDLLNYQELRHAYKQVIHHGKQSDWEIVRI